MATTKYSDSKTKRLKYQIFNVYFYDLTADNNISNTGGLLPLFRDL
jgi:hypothetical protein